jgi:hypothetical protein
MRTPFDPKLKEAMEEIKPILKKYDCMGALFLVSPTHAEYLYHLDASWSVIKFEYPRPDQVGFRIRSKKEDFPSKEAQHFATESTVHFLTSCLQFGRKLQHEMGELVTLLGKHMKIAYQVWDK